MAHAAVESNVPANIELVRRVFEVFTRRDIEAMLALCAPEIEFWGPTASFAREGQAYVGHEGMRQYFADVARVWRVLEVVPHDFRDLGDRVLVFGRVYARGEGGYISDSPTQWIWAVKDGLVVSGRVFTNRAEALAAAGLEE
jgi:ketosteroid isomerase-like protein